MQHRHKIARAVARLARIEFDETTNGILFTFVILILLFAPIGGH